MVQRRVVITGLGAVTPLGLGVETLWRRLCAGESGVGELSKVDRRSFARTRAAEVRAWDTAESRDSSLLPHGRALGYSLSAAREALADARLEEVAQRSGMGCVLGTTMGNQDVVERVIDGYDLKHEQRPPPAAARELAYFRNGHLSAELARRLELRGPALVFPTACAAGNYALATAASLIALGRCDSMLAGGADPFTRTCYTIFYRLGASSPLECRPFSADRDGMVVGEGAAVLVLEELEQARARGARIYAEVTGYGLACDAHHRTAPHPEGRGAILAIRSALAAAALSPEDIGYVSAHGTGTAANDASEANALAAVFGQGLSRLPVSSIKSMIGHCMGAASAIEAVACSLAVHQGLLPPTANTRDVDASFPVPLDIVPQRARRQNIRHAMSNAFAFGGCTSSVIFSKCETDS